MQRRLRRQLFAKRQCAGSECGDLALSKTPPPRRRSWFGQTNAFHTMPSSELSTQKAHADVFAVSRNSPSWCKVGDYRLASITWNGHFRPLAVLQMPPPGRQLMRTMGKAQLPARFSPPSPPGPSWPMQRAPKPNPSSAPSYPPFSLGCTKLSCHDDDNHHDHADNDDDHLHHDHR